MQYYVQLQSPAKPFTAPVDEHPSRTPQPRVLIGSPETDDDGSTDTLSSPNAIAMNKPLNASFESPTDRLVPVVPNQLKQQSRSPSPLPTPHVQDKSLSTTPSVQKPPLSPTSTSAMRRQKASPRSPLSASVSFELNEFPRVESSDVELSQLLPQSNPNPIPAHFTPTKTFQKKLASHLANLHEDVQFAEPVSLSSPLPRAPSPSDLNSDDSEEQ